MRTFRFLMACAFDMEIDQMDVTIVYLNAEDELIVVACVPGFILP